MIGKLGRSILGLVAGFLYWIISLPYLLIRCLRQAAIGIAAPRWYWIGFTVCSAGFWPLGLYGWEHPSGLWYVRFPLRILSILFFFVGAFLFIQGLWIGVGILVLTRLLLWVDQRLRLEQPITSQTLDTFSLYFIGAIFLVLAINKERLMDQMDPSDHYYHMAVAQKILERGTIPLWDDWEFAPMGRPHLYPPLIHLLLAFFAGKPDQVISGFNTIQMLLLPLALWTHWFFIRRYFGASMAFPALLILSMEFMFVFGSLMGLPATLVNLFLPWILLAFLEKRTYIATLLLAAAYYTHTGMPLLISLGLLIYGFWNIQYYRRAFGIVIGAMILSLPWSVRYLVFHDWMHSAGMNSIGSSGLNLIDILHGMLSLQFINPIFWILVIRGWIKAKDPRLIIFKSQIFGFLPLLFQYGGRFVMHGAPLWSPLIAWNFEHFLGGNASRRRAVGFMLCTLIPLPCISYLTDSPTWMIPKPFVSITASHFCLVFTFNREKKDPTDLEKLVETIRSTTEPDTIIHLPDAVYHFGDLVVVRTGRRTDSGGWGEIYKPEMWDEIQKSRKNPEGGVFVSRFRENIPSGCEIRSAGSYFVGYPRVKNSTVNLID